MMDGKKEKLKKTKYERLYMDIAERISKMSYAKRLQVGCVLVKEDSIISYGWNGMPAGWDNNCEYEHYSIGNPNDFELKTRPEVLHSEENCLMKLSKTHNSGKGATLFVTHAPCIQCAKLIYGAGIKEVIYKSTYRDTAGLDFLFKCGVSSTKLGESNESI